VIETSHNNNGRRVLAKAISTISLGMITRECVSLYTESVPMEEVERMITVVIWNTV